MNFYAYDGSSWRDIATVYAYDGTTWQEISECWAYDGSVWRQVCGGAGCSCSGVSITSWVQSDDATGCTCTSRFKTQHVEVRWTLAGEDRDCHHVRVERSSNGSSWTSFVTDLDLTGVNGTGCTVGAYEGCYESLCVTHLYYWRVKVELDSDDTVCDTSSSSQANNCLV